MDRTTGLSKKQKVMLTSLLGIAVFAPVLLSTNARLPWIPAWLGGVIALVGLTGALLVFWQTRALRTRFLVLFFVGIGVAAVGGALIGHA